MENEKFTPTTRGREQVVPIKEKFLITVPEAAKYFGIGTKQMRRLAENHLSDFAIFMGNRYLIVRPRVEEYVIEFMTSGEKQFR